MGLSRWRRHDLDKDRSRLGKAARTSGYGQAFCMWNRRPAMMNASIEVIVCTTFTALSSIPDSTLKTAQSKTQTKASTLIARRNTYR